MQIVYLSNRPAVLRDTWQHVRHFMPWIDRAVVVAPARAHRELASWTSGEPVDLVADEELTGASATDLGELDHVRRNVRLRRALVAAGGTDDTFVLSDDDYRPLRAVPLSFFTGDDGDVGYYSYDLAAWPSDETDFDRAQHVTHDALTYLGYPHLAYGAHMPQLMRRELWTEAFDVFSTVSDDDMVCEWALYFNVAQHLHPERFAPSRPFETLGWPQYGAEWDWWVRPAGWTFENFYPDMYEPGHLFAGLPTALVPADVARTNFEKITRWTEFARRARQLDFPADVYNPWTKHSRLRRAYFGALRPARKTYRYLTERQPGHGRG